jgi:predicted RNA-binding Zn ribbon-like protein
MADPVVVLPGEPVPVRLMNTIWADGEGVHDALTSTTDLRTWLRSSGLASARARVDDAELHRARRLRDALRRLAALAVGDTRAAATSTPIDPDEAVAAVNDAAAAPQLVPMLVRHGKRLVLEQASSSGTPVDVALSQVAVEAAELLAAVPARLRACNAPRCVLYFVKDHPRREWCSAACGNRARAARHYRRHRKAGLRSSTG